MDGVVFDFDGVIAKSMEQHAEAYRRILAPLGVTVTDEAVFLREGARTESILRDLLTHSGHAFTEADVEGLADRKQEVFERLGQPPLYPGAREMVAAVQERVPTAIVTGTRRENLEKIIPDLVGRFDAVLSADSYSHDKPHPEPFRRAAEELGLPPADCLAVENAIRGVQSARAAGYGEVHAITTTLDATQLRSAGATAIHADHERLRDGILDRLASHK